jgi:hypothetical protein
MGQTHRPLTHVAELGHVLPHSPQFSPLVWRSTHASNPGNNGLGHLVNPGQQSRKVQKPVDGPDVKQQRAPLKVTLQVESGGQQPLTVVPPGHVPRQHWVAVQQLEPVGVGQGTSPIAQVCASTSCGCEPRAGVRPMVATSARSTPRRDPVFARSIAIWSNRFPSMGPSQGSTGDLRAGFAICSPPPRRPVKGDDSSLPYRRRTQKRCHRPEPGAAGEDAARCSLRRIAPEAEGKHVLFMNQQTTL